MKSRYLEQVYKMVFLGVLALSFAGCNQSAQQQRRGQVAGAGPTAINANGMYARGGVNCNINDTNPNDMASPYNPQSPCVNPNLITQAQAAGVVPGNIQQQQNLNQQPQVRLDANGNPINPNTPPNMNNTNISLDIPADGSGRIVNRHFRLAGGAGEETVTDNCHYLNPRDPDVQTDSYDEDINHRRTPRLLTPTDDRFDLYFDSQGNLTIFGQSINGEASSPTSDGPVPYTLNADDQTIHVGSFRMIGPVRPDFAKKEKALGIALGSLITANEAALLGIAPGPITSPQAPNLSTGSPGFSLGNSSSNSYSSTTQQGSGFRAQPLSATIETPAIVELSVEGFTGQIFTYPPQPQHITQIVIEKLPFSSRTFVDAKPNNCVGTGSGQLVDLHLKPAQ